MKAAVVRGGFSKLAIAAACIALIALFLPVCLSAREPVARRLLRTIQIGVPQDVTIAEIQKIAESNGTDYTTEMLARSALLVLGQDEPKLISYDELFDDLLSHLVSDGTPFQPLPALPGFRARETVMTMVYAMVMSGNQDRAVEILENHAFNGSRYKQGVVLSALRNVGTPRAISVIQQYAEKGQDRNLAENTLADEDYPVLFEMHDRWSLIPLAQRTQDNLRAIVQRGCDQRSALAAYWLGYFAPNIDPNKETAELQALENMARTNSGSCEMMEHVIALKALGLRSAETVDYWKPLAQRTPNVWERHQIVINAYGHWGAKFAPAALELLKTDDAQYVQWELLNGNLETRRGLDYRNYWDIWLPADVLVALEQDEAQMRYGNRRIMDEDNLDAMLDWLDSGARPRDPVLLNHMIYHLLEFTSGDDTRRLLSVFNALPMRNQNWWILQTLRDRAALPLLNYWSTLPAANQTEPSQQAKAQVNDQQEILQHVIAALGSQSPTNRAAAAACCEATELCLLQQVRHNTATALSADTEIHSEEEARKWLAGGSGPAVEIKIRYADELKRSAGVRLSDGAEEKWQYLYDCWRRVDEPAATKSHEP